ncbi:hypothetical protein OEZ86_002127 [Tetradesmus obliquus]|nr:hypothetical protein OEZ86_002127 [Tetradesmus obliquus]
MGGKQDKAQLLSAELLQHGIQLPARAKAAVNTHFGRHTLGVLGSAQRVQLQVLQEALQPGLLAPTNGPGGAASSSPASSLPASSGPASTSPASVSATVDDVRLEPRVMPDATTQCFLTASKASAAASALARFFGCRIADPCLYGLLDHFGLPDELCEWLEAGLQALAASGADAAAAAAAAAGQQQQAESRMERFAGDYAYLRMWASKGRAQKAQIALQRLLGRVLPAPPPPPPAAAATAQPFPGMPVFTAGMRFIDVEPCLYDLLLHFGLPDELCERLPDALEVLGASSANAAAAGQQQQQGETKMGRFAGDYVRLRMWAGRGRVQQVQAALQTLLANVGV